MCGRKMSDKNQKNGGLGEGELACNLKSRRPALKTDKKEKNVGAKRRERVCERNVKRSWRRTNFQAT